MALTVMLPLMLLDEVGDYLGGTLVEDGQCGYCCVLSLGKAFITELYVSHWGLCEQRESGNQQSERPARSHKGPSTRFTHFNCNHIQSQPTTASELRPPPPLSRGVSWRPHTIQ